MKQVRKYLIVIFTLGVLVFSSQAEALHVTVLTAEEGGAYQDFARAFTEAAQQQNLSLNILHSITLPSETDLIVAVGFKSALIAASSHFPVLCVLVSKAGFEKLVQELPGSREHKSFSAIYYDQPARRQLALIIAALPEAKNIGLLYSTNTQNTAEFHKVTLERGLELHGQKLGSAESLYRDLQSVLEKSDVLLATPDTEIYNSLTVRNILLSTYRRNIPVVGFSASFVRAGALCAVFSSLTQIAAQAATLTGQFALTDRLSGPQYTLRFEVECNLQVARSLGIQIKENAELVREIRAASVLKEGAE